MPKINHEEYEVLKEALNEGYKWIARDSHNPLCTHRHKPVKQDHWIQQYWGNVGNGYKEIDDRLFQFIQWEDSEPYNIAELIEEYEKDYKGSWEHAIEFSGEVFGESEETEVKKDIEWLKEEVWKQDIVMDKGYIYTDDLISIINELDEPEVLSQEWIDENKEMYLINDTSENAVPDYKLQNLLVPKQELPVIPKFVAEWIEETKPYKSLRVAFEYIAQRKRDNHDDKLAFWVEEGNSETFARAWLDGYEVEEEQKYVIKLDDESYLQRYEIDNKNIVTPFRIVGHLKEVAIKFDNKERAEKVAELVEGKVEELE